MPLLRVPKTRVDMTKLLFLFFLIACSRAHIETQSTHAKEYRILLFAAGFCKPCREELKELNGWSPKNASVTVYLVGGANPGKEATKEYAKTFKEELSLTFDVVPDKYARLYSKYYDQPGPVPATVITTDSGDLVKVFVPHKITKEEIESCIK